MSTMKKIIILVFILVTALIILFSCRPQGTEPCYIVIVQKVQVKDHPYARYKIRVYTDFVHMGDSDLWFTDSADKYEVGDTLNIRK